MKDRAIVTGVLGQDGSYLSEFLLEKGYKVYGIYKRNSSGTNFSNVEDILDNPNLELVESDILEYPSMTEMIGDIKPEMFFNLAAMSHVGYSFRIPTETFRVNAEAVIAQLDIIRRLSPETRYYQASTSEMLGGVNCPQRGYTEDSPFDPRSPYAVAKVAAHSAVKNYRDAYNIFACAGILFNHSSERRGVDFATRKITMGVANILAGNQDKLRMGNMEAFRDEGHSKDYVRAQYLMLMQDNPVDYIISTGETASIQQMLEYVCYLAGLDYKDVYERDERYMRPSDVPYLLGDCTKAKSELQWQPEYNWQSTLKAMFENDCKSLGLKQKEGKWIIE
jgi:GDPmannose 4,6-dehydratase